MLARGSKELIPWQLISEIDIFLLRLSRIGILGSSDWLVGNALDTIQIVGQFSHPLARHIVVGALGRLLKGGADVGDGLESIGAPRAPHLVPQTRHGLKVNSIQGFP